MDRHREREREGSASAKGKEGNNGADGGLYTVHTTGQSFYYFRFILSEYLILVGNQGFDFLWLVDIGAGGRFNRGLLERADSTEYIIGELRSTSK